MELQKCGGCLSCLLIPLALWSIVINILLYFPDGKVLYASSNHLTNYVWYFEGICFSGIMVSVASVVFAHCFSCDFHSKCINYNNLCSAEVQPASSMLALVTGIVQSLDFVLSVTSTLDFSDAYVGSFFNNPGSRCLPSMLPERELHQNVQGGRIVVSDMMEVMDSICSLRNITLCLSFMQSFISAVLALLGIAFSGYSLIISTLGLVQGPYCKTPDGWEYVFKNTAGRYLLDHSAWSACSEPAFVVEWNIILFAILIALSSLQVLICFLKVTAELKRILCGTYPVLVQ
ncbi:hypothetical protein lerEdw1_008260, partial [Lerista edwardsae]